MVALDMFIDSVLEDCKLLDSVRRTLSKQPNPGLCQQPEAVCGYGEGAVISTHHIIIYLSTGSPGCGYLQCLCCGVRHNGLLINIWMLWCCSIGHSK